MTTDTLATKWDNVKKPCHYANHPSGIECCEISKYLSAGLSQAFQYVWRFEDKGGTQDLEKAIKWIEIELTIEPEDVHHLNPDLILRNLNCVLVHETDHFKSTALEVIAKANSFDNGTRRGYLACAISAITDLIVAETGGIGAP